MAPRHHHPLRPRAKDRALERNLSEGLQLYYPSPGDKLRTGVSHQTLTCTWTRGKIGVGQGDKPAERHSAGSAMPTTCARVPRAALGKENRSDTAANRHPKARNRTSSEKKIVRSITSVKVVAVHDACEEERGRAIWEQRIKLRVLRALREAVEVPVRESLYQARWYHKQLSMAVGFQAWGMNATVAHRRRRQQQQVVAAADAIWMSKRLYSALASWRRWQGPDRCDAALLHHSRQHYHSRLVASCFRRWRGEWEAGRVARDVSFAMEIYYEAKLCQKVLLAWGLAARTAVSERREALQEMRRAMDKWRAWVEADRAEQESRAAEGEEEGGQAADVNETSKECSEETDEPMPMHDDNGVRRAFGRWRSCCEEHRARTPTYPSSPAASRETPRPQDPCRWDRACVATAFRHWRDVDACETARRRDATAMVSRDARCRRHCRSAALRRALQKINRVRRLRKVEGMAMETAQLYDAYNRLSGGLSAWARHTLAAREKRR